MLAENTKYIFTADELDEILEREKSIVIYGAGDYGRRTADYIISVGKQSKIECFWITDKGRERDYRGINILESGQGHLTGNKNSIIIIAVSFMYLFEIAENVQQYGRRYCCVTQDLYVELGRRVTLGICKKKFVPYKQLDFLVAGFAKCGTTSLHKVLSEVDDIYLSEKKESTYFLWCDQVENPMDKLIAEYFNRIQEGQIVGMIEPTFWGWTEQIQELFGRQVNILFLVRNPVDAVFSAFKMFCRGGGAKFLQNIYEQSGGVYGEDTFRDFFEQYKEENIIAVYRYADGIKQFMKYYPREQIKIVIFEEMVKDPKKSLTEILQFIGSTHGYAEDNLPWVNEGNFIMADIEGLKIAERKRKIYFECEYFTDVSDKSKDVLFSELIKAEEQYKRAKKIYNLRLTGELRKNLEGYYDDSVRQLEKLLDKDLSKIWF